MPARASVLVVCTGNVCRSPYIQLSLGLRLQRVFGDTVVVESGGTHALTGSPTAPAIAEALWEQGVDASGFRARQVTLEQIDRAGLIITASREHRSAVARMRPQALSRLFTLRQVARLLDGSQPPRRSADPVSSVAAHCARRRGTVTPSAGLNDDVPDPWGRDEAAYRESIGLMTPAIEVLAGALSPRDVAR